MKTLQVLALATVAAAGLVFAGCEMDDSRPTRPITRENRESRENAEKRELEAPKRNLPTSGSEFPGQSQVTPTAPQQVATLTTWATPQDSYTRSNFGGPLPHLPTKPASAPTPGSTPVPGTPWSIEHSWGEVQPLTAYPHRNFPAVTVNYVDGAINHNPTYYWTPQTGNQGLDQLVEAPWFFINTVALPAFMILDCPWGNKVANRKGEDPNYHGYLPASAGLAPTMQPGEIKYEYNFYKGETRPAK